MAAAIAPFRSTCTPVRPSTQGIPAQQHRHAAATHRPRRAPTHVRALFGGNKDGGGGGGNPFANMGNLMENVKKAQMMVQQETARVQQELQEMEFEGYSEDELVRAVMNGNQTPVTVDITEEAMALGPEKLSEAVTQALKEAHSNSTAGMKAKMRELASSLGLPNLPTQ